MNKEQLLEDVKFPLKWDSDNYKMYIFDAEMNMITQVDRDLDATNTKHPFEKLIGDYKEVKSKMNPNFNLYQGDFYEYKEGKKEIVGLIRGWGRLSNKYDLREAAERQDNVAEYILNVINS